MRDLYPGIVGPKCYAPPVEHDPPPLSPTDGTLRALRRLAHRRLDDELDRDAGPDPTHTYETLWRQVHTRPREPLPPLVTLADRRRRVLAIARQVWDARRRPRVWREIVWRGAAASLVGVDPAFADVDLDAVFVARSARGLAARWSSCCRALGDYTLRGATDRFREVERHERPRRGR
jgi:hypothetical protein